MHLSWLLPTVHTVCTCKLSTASSWRYICTYVQYVYCSSAAYACIAIECSSAGHCCNNCGSVVILLLCRKSCHYLLMASYFYSLLANGVVTNSNQTHLMQVGIVHCSPGNTAFAVCWVQSVCTEVFQLNALWLCMLRHVLAPLKGYICLYYKPPSIPSCFVMTMLVWTCMQQLLIIEVISVIIEVISLSFFLRKTHYKAMYLRMRVLLHTILLCFDHAGLDLYAADIHNWGIRLCGLLPRKTHYKACGKPTQTDTSSICGSGRQVPLLVLYSLWLKIPLRWPVTGCLWCGAVSCEMEVRYSGCSMSCSLLYNWFWVDCHCLTLHTVEVQHWQEVTIICNTIQWRCIAQCCVKH